MTIIQAAVYGMIQGLTEFLPVSSSAHLALFPWLFGWKDPGLAFDVALHWGTLCGVVIYFWKDIRELAMGWLGSIGGRREQKNILPWQIILATIPGGLAGVALEKKAETIFRSPLLIALALGGLGILLYIADKKNTSRLPLTQLSWGKALSVGLSQALAIIPGVSRSGITITTGLFLNLDRDSAVRFSFLLSIPIILGAGLKKTGYLLHNVGSVVLWVGFATSALSGLAAIHFLLNFVKKRSFTPFAVYRILLALFILAWFSLNFR